jgi:hypothetical protein
MMNPSTQDLVLACWRSPIFGDSYDSSVSQVEIESLTLEREQAFIAAFTPIVARGMPESPPETRDLYVRSMSRPIVGLFLSLAVELRDVDLSTRACIHYALSFWGNNFLDRGDLAMEKAIQLFLTEQNAYSELETFIGAANTGPEQVNRRHFPDTNSAAVQARLGALREIQTQIMFLCRPEDESVLLHERSLSFLKHSLGMYRFTQAYLQERRSDFWERYAFHYAKHMILSNSLFSYIGLFYAMFRRERPDLPSLAEIMEVQPLMRLVEGLANSAARIFDDVGDRRIDDGEPLAWISVPESRRNKEPRTVDDRDGEERRPGRAKLKSVSLFSVPDPTLIRAFFHFIGITDEALIDQAVKGFQLRNRRGDEIIIKLWVDLSRKQISALPSEILQRYSLYVTLIKRSIECGFINCVGDMAFTHG